MPDITVEPIYNDTNKTATLTIKVDAVPASTINYVNNYVTVSSRPTQIESTLEDFENSLADLKLWTARVELYKSQIMPKEAYTETVERINAPGNARGLNFIIIIDGVVIEFHYLKNQNTLITLPRAAFTTNFTSWKSYLEWLSLYMVRCHDTY